MKLMLIRHALSQSSYVFAYMFVTVISRAVCGSLLSPLLGDPLITACFPPLPSLESMNLYTHPSVPTHPLTVRLAR